MILIAGKGRFQGFKANSFDYLEMKYKFYAPDKKLVHPLILAKMLYPGVRE